MRYKIISVILVVLLICSSSSWASRLTVSAISVTNHVNQATVFVNCNVVPTYTIFTLHNPERVVIDFFNVYKVQKNIFPINFNSVHLIKCIRTSVPSTKKTIRIVLDLTSISDIKSITQKKIKNHFCIIITVLKKKTFGVVPNSNIYSVSPIVEPEKINTNGISETINYFDKITQKIRYSQKKIQNVSRSSIIVVAIDAGHGGQDPGAMGKRGTYEKNITINIAKKLKSLLDLDPMFEAVMIRDGDYFLSVMERSEIARKKGANVLISIHADAALNASVRGASVWILSNRRAESETIHWLQQRKEKHAELLGGLGDILTNYYKDPYFNHLVLDLQFGYTQRVGYDIALNFLHQLKNVSILHKKTPEFSGFGILRSPDIPSILVETGFISNTREECLLSSSKYQKKIAQALYQGLRTYFTIIAHSQKQSSDRI